MKDLIRKILKEEEDDGFNWADSASNPPRDILDDAYRRFKWSVYIPILGKKIKFYLNPEHWNLMANIRIEDVGSRGHGSFGDDPHRDYQPSVLKDLPNITTAGGERERTYYSKENTVGQSDTNRRVYVDIEQVIDDIEGYSTEAKQHTEEYQRQIESLTRQYMEKMSGLGDKYNFNDSYGAETVVVQDGQIRREDDFPTSRYNRM
jgi:hypothetical protein